VGAFPALGREERHDLVAGRDGGDVRAQLFDDAGALMPEHGRCVAGRIGPGRGVEIGVADPAGRQADEHLAGLRLGEIDLLDLKRLTELLEDSSLDLQRRSFSLVGKRRGRPPLIRTTA
jgi:hypothetical protein